MSLIVDCVVTLGSLPDSVTFEYFFIDYSTRVHNGPVEEMCKV
jgi:hypothetical protein